MRFRLFGSFLASLPLVVACGTSAAHRVSEIHALSRDPTPEHLSRIHRRLKDPDRSVRATAVSVLAAAAAPEARDAALAALDDPDEFVRATAAKCLGDLRDVASAERLLRLLREDGNWRVRQRCAEALGEIASEVGTNGLVEAMHDPEPTVRLSVARALSKSPPAQRIDLLSRMVVEDLDWEVRAEAAAGLGRALLPEAFPPLEHALTDPNEFVRTAAARGLRDLRQAGITAPPPPAEKTTEAVEPAHPASRVSGAPPAGGAPSDRP